MSKLNPKAVEHAPPKSKEYRRADGAGLFLRIRPSGSKSWLFCFRLPGNRRLLQMTLGSVDDISLKEARLALPELRKLVSKGIDPRSERAATKTKNAQAITMQTLFNAWIEFLKLTNEVSLKWITRHENRWDLHLKKSLGTIFAKDITRAHLAAALDAMSRKGIKEETRKALTTLNLMLDYGLTRHFIESNTARLLKPKDFAATAGRPRDRVLSIKELRRLWAALDQVVIVEDGIASSVTTTTVTSTAIKLLILTGARRGEVAAMRWDELDFETESWSIPSYKTKNRQSHVIYLSPFAVELLENMRLVTGKSQFVFDTGKNGQGHIHTHALTRALRRLRVKDKEKKNKKIKDAQAITEKKPLKKQKKKAEPPLKDMKPFTIHDLRRSGATAWGEHLKVAPHVIERMLNHQPLNKLVATYQRATYAKEQKAAWLAWSVVVEQQIAKEPSNVVPFQNAVGYSND